VFAESSQNRPCSSGISYSEYVSDAERHMYRRQGCQCYWYSARSTSLSSASCSMTNWNLWRRFIPRRVEGGPFRAKCSKETVKKEKTDPEILVHKAMVINNAIISLLPHR